MGIAGPATAEKLPPRTDLGIHHQESAFVLFRLPRDNTFITACHGSLPTVQSRMEGCTGFHNAADPTIKSWHAATLDGRAIADLAIYVHCDAITHHVLGIG